MSTRDDAVRAMRDFDDLAELIMDVGEYISGTHAHDYISPDKAADAILAAGYRPPVRVITTAADAVRLPTKSVLLNERGDSYQKHRGLWYGADMGKPLATPHLPATVLWEEDA